jgi:hypothetical protein
MPATSIPLASGGIHHRIELADSVRVSDSVATALRAETSADAPRRYSRMERTAWEAAGLGLGMEIGSHAGRYGWVVGGAAGWAAARRQTK